METTIKVRLKAVHYGYDHKTSRYYTSERGYWVNTLINGEYVREWNRTYIGLQIAVKARYGIELPKESKLHWVNYGTPYNTAKL